MWSGFFPVTATAVLQNMLPVCEWRILTRIFKAWLEGGRSDSFLFVCFHHLDNMLYCRYPVDIFDGDIILLLYCFNPGFAATHSWEGDLEETWDSKYVDMLQIIELKSQISPSFLCVRWRGLAVLASESFISPWVCGSTRPGNTLPS